ncbi:MAG: radical SAM protein [Nitrososphaerota archaeon]|nr:B12-binding domain-containing radical SAM protein [Candidatus Bathyarchaeota archaeon]MDW8048835.1 radical SAM protein [Nitrososphaerota archaeon]
MGDFGYPIVLTADRTLMSEYGGAIFLGFSACVPKGLVPDKVYFSVFCPPIDVNDDGSVTVAPCGTRKVEATLLEHGFAREDVIVAHPDHLEKVIGSRTKVLGLTENDPLGIGPATTTFTAIFGGQAYNRIKFMEILKNPVVKKFRPKIIVGGPGAWQLEDEETRRELGVDCVVIGEGEKVVPSLFKEAVEGGELPRIVYGDTPSIEEIPVIKGGTICGLVEISRGCGRNCAFCMPTMMRHRCLPIPHILREVEVNLRAGRQPLLHAEDVLRYGARGIDVNREAVLELFRSVKNHPGVKGVGISHFALASVAAAPDLVEEISCILNVNEKRWLSGQTGIETGSPNLIKRHMMGKCRPFKPEEWPSIVVKAFEILSDNNWVPCATLMFGLPGETEKDAEITLELIKNLRPFKSLIVPLFLVTAGRLRKETESFSLERMTPTHAELFLECWKHNLDWAPELIRDWARVSLKNPLQRAGLNFIFSYGMRRVKKLIETCETEYNYDLAAMVRDFREKKSPIRLLSAMTRIPILQK